MFDNNDARMQSESSRRRRNDENIARPKFDIFDNFCYVLFVVNEIVILSENSILERSGTTPGQEMR